MSTRAKSFSSLFPLLLVGVLAGVSFWLEQASRAQYGGGDGRIRHDPDYIVDNFILRRFNTEGILLHTLVGEEMRHFPDDDSTVVLQPRHTFHRDPPTFIVAREAQVDGKGEHVRLIDDVRVMRGGKSGKPDTVITTQMLDAYPDDEIAKTEVPVVITQNKSQIRGDTLNSDNKTSIYVLTGQVRGVFFRNGGMTGPRNVLPIVQPKAEETVLAEKRPIPKIAAEPKPKPQIQPQTKPLLKPPTGPKSQAKPQIKPQVKPQTKPQAKPKSQPTTKPNAAR